MVLYVEVGVKVDFKNKKVVGIMFLILLFFVMVIFLEIFDFKLWKDCIVLIILIIFGFVIVVYFFYLVYVKF